MAKKNVAGALVGTAIRGGLGFALSRGKVDPVTGIASAPTTGDRFRTAARLTIPAFAAEDRFQTEEQQLGITRAGLAETRAGTNISAFEAESQDRLRQAQTAKVKQEAEKEENLDKRLDFDTILPKGLKGDSFLIPEVKDLLVSIGGVVNKDGEITARTFKELNDTDEGRQSFQRGMKGIIERRLGNLDKSETILKGSVKNQLQKFNETNATNITFEDLNNPEIRENLGDSKLLEQSKNLQGIQQKREIFRGARDKLDDVIGETGRKPSAFEEKVTALESTGALRTDAIKEIAGATQIVTNPISGESFLFDKTTRVLEPLDPFQKVEIEKIQGQSIAESKSPDDITLWEMVNLSTGVLSSMIAMWNKTGAIPGQFVGLGAGQKTEFARSQSRLAVQDLANALQRNPKFAEGERKWIIDNLDLEPKTLDTEDAMKIRMSSVAEIINRRIEQEKGVVNNKNMPKERRQHATTIIDSLVNFNKKLGVPEESVSKVKNTIKGMGEELDLSPDVLERLNKYR